MNSKYIASKILKNAIYCIYNTRAEGAKKDSAFHAFMKKVTLSPAKYE